MGYYDGMAENKAMEGRLRMFCDNSYCRPLLLLMLLYVSGAAFADIIHEGKVIRIIDGDTLVLLVD